MKKKLWCGNETCKALESRRNCLWVRCSMMIRSHALSVGN